jgi:HEAT repeat protein
MCKPFLFSLAALFVACAAGRAAEPDEKLVRELVALFKDPKNKPEVRSTAIRALGTLGWPGRTALPDLIKVLEDPQERKAAADSLGPYYQAIVAVGQMGTGAQDAAPALVKAKGIAPAYDQAIDVALGNILQQPGGGVFALIGALRDNDPSVRLMAAKALRRYPADVAPVLPALREATKDPDADVRRVAEESVRVVTQDEVTRLAQLLKDKDDNVRLLAAKALGRMGPPAAAAAPVLKEAAVKDADPDVRCVAKNALAKVMSGGDGP